MYIAKIHGDEPEKFVFTKFESALQFLIEGCKLGTSGTIDDYDSAGTIYEIGADGVHEDLR